MSSLTPRVDRLDQNYIINGDMRIAQRATSVVAIADNTFCLDRWKNQKVGTGVHTVSQDTDAPTFSQANYLFQNSIRYNLTTPDTSIAAGDIYMLTHRIEGYNWANLAQKTFTLSFWVKATLTGTYCVGFTNGGDDRSYVAEYTINASNTWERKSITVSASPSAGTWNYANGTGLNIRFTFAAGSTYQSSAGSWQTGFFVATSNQINGVNTGATDFRITGVSVTEGSGTGTQFSTFSRNYQGELEACQRYYEMSYNLGTPVGTAASGVEFAGRVSDVTNTGWVSQVRFKTRKRSSSYTMYTWCAAGNGGGGANGRITTWSGGISTNNVIPTNPGWAQSDVSWDIYHTGNVSGYQYHWACDAEL